MSEKFLDENGSQHLIDKLYNEIKALQEEVTDLKSSGSSSKPVNYISLTGNVSQWGEVSIPYAHSLPDITDMCITTSVYAQPTADKTRLTLISPRYGGENNNISIYSYVRIAPYRDHINVRTTNTYVVKISLIVTIID